MINSVNSNNYAAASVSTAQADVKSKDAKTSSEAEVVKTDSAVIYEPSAEAKKASEDASTASTRKESKVDQATIEKLKADADARNAQLRGIVEKLLTQQGEASKKSDIWEQFKNSDDDSFWSNLRQGLKDGTIKVDEATAKQAAEDVSEDGYWGVKQTSERILDFAKALAGKDPSKAEELRKAVQEGFNQATKAWGDELPEISKKTLEAVNKGFDEWIKNGQ